MDTIKIRWVLAHEPIELFLRAANKFSEEIKSKTSGQISIEVMTLSEYSKKYKNGAKVTKLDLLNLMEAGEIEMSQMYTTTLGRYNQDMYALDMPFLFRNHEHAAKVLEGDIGQNLMNGLSKASNIQGLAFTYSGGYRMIVANKPLRTMEDFKDVKIRVAKSPVAVDLIKSVGAEPVPMELEEINDAIYEDKIDGGESTYPRFYSMKQNEVTSFINDTQHSLFLTSIIVSKSFWSSLPKDLQAIMSSAALSAANTERQESVDDVSVIQNKCKQDGVEIVFLNNNEQEKMKKATEPMYEKYDKVFSSDLLKNIKAVH